MRPCASTTVPFISNSRYLKEVLPILAIRIFMERSIVMLRGQTDLFPAVHSDVQVWYSVYRRSQNGALPSSRVCLRPEKVPGRTVLLLSWLGPGHRRVAPRNRHPCSRR